MTDTTAAHEILRDAWGDVHRFDRYAMGVLGALIAAPDPAPSLDALADAGGVRRAIVDHAIDQLAAHGYIDRLRAVAPHLAEVLDGSAASNVTRAVQPPTVSEPAQLLPLAVRRAFTISTDTVLDAFEALENAPLALDGPSLEALQQAARDRLRTHSEFTGADLDNLAGVVAGYIWDFAEEEPAERRRHVLESVPRAPINRRQVVEREVYRLANGRWGTESILMMCRSIYAEANFRAASQRLETATAPDPLTPEELEAAAVDAAQRVAELRKQQDKREKKSGTGQAGQKSQKPHRR